ncbi:DUF5995 family protein [Mycobacterium sp.]|jgi:hypothetical protein|uniref:DUF5995 family protein n=1 Tax=Mycobacterium sp. TaxID=1785 RepID=UPI002D49E625|nr:DUF5995 family protein [Mycobacterium sp.]HZA11786.1 DUF5995 family protein [Mycobacterium sp.]
MPIKPPPPPPIPPCQHLDEVVEALASVIDWSIATSSRLGYFAALYKRITIAVGTALNQGAFDDGPRMERFDVAFASRYLDALNGYFHPEKFRKPTSSWRVTFEAAGREEPIIVQHMLGGVNAHIVLDLGIVAATINPGPRLPTLKDDFYRINAVLASQVNGVVASIGQLSPALADLYAVLMEHEILLINEAVKQFRDSAWRFAVVLALEPGFARPATIWARDRHVAERGELMYDPPGLVGLIDSIVEAIAARESRDIARNIEVLDKITSAPAPIKLTM